MGENGFLLRLFLYGVFLEATLAANGHVNVEFEILQFDNPTGTSYHGTDLKSVRKCCDVDSQKVNCPTQQCDTSFVICLGGVSNGRCAGPMYNSPSSRMENQNSYISSYDNRRVFTFIWDNWHSGPMEYKLNLMDYDTSSRQDLIDNFTLTTSLNVSSSYEQSIEEMFSLRNYASIDFSIRVWCQDGYGGPDCSQQCTPHDSFHICDSHGTSQLSPSCLNTDVLTILMSPSSTVTVTYNYTPAMIKQRLFDFIAKEICQNATSLYIDIVHFSLSRSIEFKATCDGISVDNLLFTTHLYVLGLTQKTNLQRYFPGLPIPTVTQKSTSGAHMFMMLEVTSYSDSSKTCSGHACTVDINVCIHQVSGRCTDYLMLHSLSYHGGNLTICDGVVSSGTSNTYLIGSTTWPVISTDIKYNGVVKMSQHNNALPVSYTAESVYNKARLGEMVLSENTQSLTIKYMIWCAQGYVGDQCQHHCRASGNRECDKNGHVVCKSGYHGSTCVDINECSTIPCKNGGTCQNTVGSYICTCPTGWSGQSCELDINECSLDYCGASATNCTNTPGDYSCTCPGHGFAHKICTDRDECLANAACTNGGTCYNLYASYHCECADGFEGIRCTEDIDECKLQVCGNHSSSCVNTIGSYNCSCLPGWSGKDCQTDINECTNNPCKYGTCHNSPGSYYCSCYSGARGEYCDDIDECGSHNPCNNNGTCVNLPPPDRFRCDCKPGWDSRSHCVRDIDECQTIRPCEHGTCNNTAGSYMCSCNEGWSGTNCTVDINECRQHTNICDNNGTCVNTMGGYRCNCQTGWQGENCSLDVNECTSSHPPCQHNGTCLNTHGGYTCTCTAGWTGSTCSVDVNECTNSSICTHGGKCQNIPGSYRCDCPSGLSGNHCEHDINECTSNPCKYGNCTNTPGSYHCTCLAGSTGRYCEDINECVGQNPCHHNGTCVNLPPPNRYRCECQPGWDNKSNCLHDIDECQINLCLHAGTCSNTNGSYDCSCTNGWKGKNCSIDIDECSTSRPCKNRATCINNDGGYTCHCTSAWTGINCTTDINECNRNPCKNKATCQNTNGGYTCHCKPGWTGINCTSDINECITVHPCKNHATCINYNGGYTCNCKTGWSGINCTSDINECTILNPCKHNATCINTDGGYRCTCTTGWTGTNCTNDIDECNSKTICLNNGSCHNTLGGYSCICATGWKGPNCNHDINECQEGDNPCQNQARCHNNPGSYTCSCKPGWTGKNCNIDVNECNTLHPCVNNGTCHNTPGGYTCSCLSGWTGHICSDDINECQHDATLCGHGQCVNTPGGYTCSCNSGWSGGKCQTHLNECLQNPCENNGTCSLTNDSFQCTCPSNWTGNKCTEDIDECQSNPCIHGTCQNLPGSYMCTCLRGYTGIQCENSINECESSSACANNATCIDLEPPRFFECKCLPGWDSKSHCRRDIDECAATVSPCVHGTCINTQGSYRCSCDHGWNGATCNSDINECEHNPCKNQATCQNTNESYICHCATGWTGVNCTIDVDECTVNPCKNEATCQNIEGGYTCHCPSSWKGDNCTIDVDECKHHTCKNQATCLNTQGGYTCRCSKGWTGVNCTKDVDECHQNPCMNQGTCHNTNGGYSCQCTPGWTGVNCTNDINECNNNPCYNKGTCQNIDGGYLCHCATGWTGNNCNSDIDECILFNPCLNGGTCLNVEGSYSCICASGFTGVVCSSNVFKVTPETSTEKLQTKLVTTLPMSTENATTTTPYTNVNKLNVCYPGVCQNNGTCVNIGVLEYYCNCTSGWSGRNCTEDVDECINDVCAGNGVCVNKPGSYSCMHLGDAIHPACSGTNWNITANMTVLKEMYPSITPNHVFFGDNSCRGIQKGQLLQFQQGFQECLTANRDSAGMLIYENTLFYAIYDPINPFIIRQHKWTYTVECDVSKNEATSSHVHHETNSEHITVAGHHQISMGFYSDPNFQTQIPGNPISAHIGDDVYVKVYTNEPDWTVKMRLHTCFTKPNGNADDTMNYYIIKDGCEVDSNTHIMSQSTHETKFVFQDFEYAANKEGLDIFCNATFCESSDYSPICAQSCTNFGGGQALIGK